MNLAIRHIKRRKEQREQLKLLRNEAAILNVLRHNSIYSPELLQFYLKDVVKAPTATEVVDRMRDGLKEAYKYECETTDLIDDLENRLDSVGTSLSLMHHYPESRDTYEPDVTVYAYMYDRAYGGPEEGGWYYNTEQPLRRETYTMSLTDAIKWCRRANDLLEMVNKNRREVSSVLSEGRYRYGWTLRSKPVAKPRHRPTYC
jgi:hypothetical protein